jgi:hypothetical protein
MIFIFLEKAVIKLLSTIAPAIIELSLSLPETLKEGFVATAAFASDDKEVSSVCTLYSSEAFCVTDACNWVSSPDEGELSLFLQLVIVRIAAKAKRVVANFICKFLKVEQCTAEFTDKRIIYFLIALK